MKINTDCGRKKESHVENLNSEANGIIAYIINVWRDKHECGKKSSHRS